MPWGSTYHSVRLFLPATAEHAWRELAERYAEGFASLGLAVDTRVDELPVCPPPTHELDLVLAPHAYPVLRAGKATVPWRARQRLEHAFVVNVASPSTTDFAATAELARYARGAFDSHPVGPAAWQSKSIPVHAAPPGLTTRWESTVRSPSCAVDSPLDLLIWGTSGPNAERFVAEHAKTLHAWNYEVHLSPSFAVPSSRGPFADPARRLESLLNRARIVLSIHDNDSAAAAWDLALRATARKCLFVSENRPGEPSWFPEPREVGGVADTPWPRIEFFLRRESERQELVERHWAWLRTERSTSAICAAMLRFSETTPPRATSGRIAVGRLLDDWTKAVVSTCAAKGRRFADKLRRPWESLSLEWRRDRLSANRRAQIERLETCHELRAAGKSDVLTRANYKLPDDATPTLAVVVSLYNYSQHISACLESLVASDLTAIPGGAEVLVVDDASTDDSAAVVANLLPTSPLRLRLLRKQLNTGLADARNVGLAATRAPYVFTLDADNLVAPVCFRPLYDAIVAARSAAAYGLIAKFDHATGAGVGLLSQCDWDESTLVQAPYIDAMALFDRQKLLQVGGYSTELLRHGWNGWEDYDLWLKLATEGERASFVPRVVAHYRVHSSSMIHSTTLFSEPLVRYFYERFHGLLDLAAHSPLRFGLPYRPSWERAAATRIVAPRADSIGSRGPLARAAWNPTPRISAASSPP